MADSKDVSVAIVGGGLVGALQACILAKKGYREVHLYEVTQTKFLSNMGNCNILGIDIYIRLMYRYLFTTSVSKRHSKNGACCWKKYKFGNVSSWVISSESDRNW